MSKNAFKTKEFLRLKEHWYKHLKDSGFEDIEDTESPNEYLKRWDSLYFHVHFTPASFQENQEYYEFVNHVLLTYEFQSLMDATIWMYHTQGKTQRETAALLKITLWKVHRLIKKVLSDHHK